MASFDFIDASAKGYEFVWDRRNYLLRLLVPVFFVKVVCLLIIFVLKVEDQFLLQGLILLPGSLLEAVFIVGLVRFLVYAEPIYVWGKPVIPDEKQPISALLPTTPTDRKRFMQAGIAVYLLIKILATGFAGAMMDQVHALQNMPQPTDLQPLHPAVSGVIFMTIGAIFMWVFRFGWTFIPAAMGYPLRAFFSKIKGIQVSFYMVLTYLICLLPVMTVFGIILNGFAIILTEGSAAYIISRYVFEAFIEMTMLSIQAVAMTYGISEILFGKKDKP